MTWTCNYLIRLSHAVNGDLLIGTLEANSLSDAQIKLVDFLKEHGMPEANISYNVTDHNQVSLKGGAVLHIAPVMTSEQWADLIPLMIAR
jgi:hypothetical protein